MWFKVRTTVLVCLHFAEQQLSADDALRKHVAIRVKPSAWLLFNVADYDQKGRLRFFARSLHYIVEHDTVQTRGCCYAMLSKFDLKRAGI